MSSFVVVGIGASGIWLVLRGSRRRISLVQRLHPYLGALKPQSSRLVGYSEQVGLSKIFEDFGARLPKFLSSDPRDLADRIAASGLPISISRFRGQQVAWGLWGFSGALALFTLLAGTGRSISPVAALGASVMFGVAGVVARGKALDRVVHRRKEQMLAEFPTVVDLICLAVTAGESLRGALEAVSNSAAGPLARELRSLLRDARAGKALSPALEACAHRLQLPPFARFVEAVVTAQERGIPLADSLRAMAHDVREQHKHNLIETAGKKQVAMLIPVVGLILPVAVVFAFYPGVIAIKSLAN